MAAITNVDVIIRAVDNNATKVLRDIGDESSNTGKKVESSFASATSASKIFAGALLAIAAAASGIIAKSTLTAARTETMGIALNAVAKATNTSTKVLAEQEKILKKQGITTQEARKMLLLFMQSELDVADASKIARVAQDLAVISGENSSQTAGTLTEAIASQNIIMLKQFGIMKSSTQIFDEYAATLGKSSTSLTINTTKTAANEAKLIKLKDQLKLATLRMGELGDKTKESSKLTAQMRIDNLTSQIASLEGHTTTFGTAAKKAGKSLTELEQSQAFVYAIMKHGEKLFGTYEAAMSTAGKKLTSLPRWFEEAANAIGEVFLPAFGGLIDALTEFLKQVTPENVKKVLAVFIKNLPIIAGIIIGGLIPAFRGLGKVIWVKVLPAIHGLIPYIIVGGLISLGIKQLIDHFGSFGEMMVYLKGKTQPFVDAIDVGITRIKQILKGFGISGEFGGLINLFQVMGVKIPYYIERTIQIISGFVQTVKNKMAGFGEGQTASWIDAFKGIYDRIKPVIEAIKAALEPLGAQFALMVSIIETQIKPAWDAMMETMKPFIAAVSPKIIEALKRMAIFVGVLVAGILLLATTILVGLVTAVANALPYILQAFEGLIQFFRGFFQLVTGLINGDWSLAMEGLKQMSKGAYDAIINTWNSLEKGISGAIKGVIDFFQNLYEKTTLVKDGIENLTTFYRDHETAILAISGTITAFFLPAIIEIGVKSAIAGTIIATKLIINIVKLGIESGIAAAVGMWNFIVNTIKLGIECGITAAVGMWNLIVNTIKLGIEGWKVIAMLLFKIIQLGIATAAIVLHATVTTILTIGTVALTAATWLLNIALAVLTSPIFLIVVAIAALIAIGYLLITHWDTIKKAAVSLWEKVKEKFEDIKEVIKKALAWIGNIIEKFKPKIKIGLDLPNFEEQWKEAKKTASKIGMPWPFKQTGGIVPGPIGAPVPIVAHGGERVTSSGLSRGGGGGGSTFNVYIGMYAGSQTEKRNIAKELYGALLQVASSQNRSVSEFMGG